MDGSVPLYKQSYGYSCGPASMLMVMGAIDRKLVLDESIETAIWEDSNLVESRATSAYGLAFSALKRGFRARVWADSDGIGFTKRLKKHFPIINVDKMNRMFEETKVKAQKLGVEEIREKTTIQTLKKELKNGAFPIVLVSTRLMGEWIAIPHWVVVTGIYDKKVTIQNPEHARIEDYPLKRFEKYLGFDKSTRMVCIFR